MKKTSRFTRRNINYLRPAPRYAPLSVEQVMGNQLSRDVVERFSDLYYTGGAAGDLNSRGAKVIKNPCDLWMVLEILQELRPAVIVETGTHMGASAHYYADMMGVLGIGGEVITVDLNPKWYFDPETKRIHSIVGYSTDEKIVGQVTELCGRILGGRDRHVVVMLDSDHSKDNVLAEMRAYAPLVTKGSYLIVEDTNVNGHPSALEHGPGPFEAVQEFLSGNESFKADKSRERFLLTFNPGGWLRRVR